MHLEMEPPNPRELRPGISEELSSVILRCLAKDPNERFHNANALRDALEASSSSIGFGS